MMTTNLFVTANVKQLRTDGSFRILLPFFPNILGCWRPKFSNFYSFHNRVEFGTIFEGLRNFGGLNPPLPNPHPPTHPVRHCVQEISWLVAELLATKGFCSSELVQYVVLHVPRHYTLAYNWHFPLVALRQHKEIRTRSTFQFDRKNFIIHGPQYSKAHRVATGTDTRSKKITEHRERIKLLQRGQNRQETKRKICA